jgi:hypothetical protein
MKVKIGDNVFDSDSDVIILSLSKSELITISSDIQEINKEAKFLFYPVEKDIQEIDDIFDKEMNDYDKIETHKINE